MLVDSEDEDVLPLIQWIDKGFLSSRLEMQRQR